MDIDELEPQIKKILKRYIKNLVDLDSAVEEILDLLDNELEIDDYDETDFSS